MTILEQILGGSVIFRSVQEHAGAYFILAIIVVVGVILIKGNNDKTPRY